MILAAYRHKEMVWRTLRLGVGFVGAAVFVLALVPLAKTIAGRHTQVDLRVSLTVSVVMTGVAAVVAAYGRNQKRRADELARRNSRLVAKLREAGEEADSGDVA